LPTRRDPPTLARSGSIPGVASRCHLVTALETGPWSRGDRAQSTQSSDTLCAVPVHSGHVGSGSWVTLSGLAPVAVLERPRDPVLRLIDDAGRRREAFGGLIVWAELGLVGQRDEVPCVAALEGQRIETGTARRCYRSEVDTAELRRCDAVGIASRVAPQRQG
jgi:hypothetical protein